MQFDQRARAAQRRMIQGDRSRFVGARRARECDERTGPEMQRVADLQRHRGVEPAVDPGRYAAQHAIAQSQPAAGR